MGRSQKNPVATQKPAVSLDADRQKRFLMLYSETGRLCQSAIAVGVHPNTVAGLRKRDPEFDAEVKLAKEIFNESLDQEIVRRGKVGYDKPVFYQGEEVAIVREYSDVLLLAAAKRHDPAYRDKQQIDVNHTGGVMIVPGKAKSPDEWVAEHGADNSEEA